MKKISKALLLFICFFIISNSSIWSQPKIKKGFKIGLELMNTLTEKTGSLNNTVGFTFGLFTGIKIYAQNNNSLNIKVELNYVWFRFYNLDHKIHYLVDERAPGWNGLHYSVFDENYSSGIVELGFIPEYSIALNEKSSLGFFFGPTIGLGSKGLAYKQKDNNKLIGDPYDEYTMGFAEPISLNLGVTYYYSVFVLDVRFRYTYLTGSSMSDVTNLYVQVGFAL